MSVDLWLDLFFRARQYFHPQHQVLCEVARFCLPVLGRGEGRTIDELSLVLAKTKEEMARSYLAVLDIVENGISRNRAKTLFELIETQLHLNGDDNSKQSPLLGTISQVCTK